MCHSDYRYLNVLFHCLTIIHVSLSISVIIHVSHYNSCFFVNLTNDSFVMTAQATQGYPDVRNNCFEKSQILLDSLFLYSALEQM